MTSPWPGRTAPLRQDLALLNPLRTTIGDRQVGLVAHRPTVPSSLPAGVRRARTDPYQQVHQAHQGEIMVKRLVVRSAVLTVAVLGGLSAVAAPAAAEHRHTLTTPGNSCVAKGGSGFGTGEAHDDTSFHARVHTGTPGAFAFQRASNPVSVVGGSGC